MLRTLPRRIAGVRHVLERNTRRKAASVPAADRHASNNQTSSYPQRRSPSRPGSNNVLYGQFAPRKQAPFKPEEVSRPPRSHECSVSTLHPDQLQPADYLDLSEFDTVRISSGESTEPIDLIYARPVKTVRLGSKISGKMEKPTSVAFPRNTRGYFYYYSPPTAPIAGALRFRCLDQPSIPFKNGHDLLDARGTPWQLPLIWALHAPAPGLVKLALDSGCIDGSFVKRARATLKGVGVENITDGMTLVYEYGQQFRIRLRNDRATVWIAHGEKIGLVMLNQLFMRVETLDPAAQHRQERATRIAPYDGLAYISFEPAVGSQRPQDEGRTFHVRVNRLIQCIDTPAPANHGITRPVEGQLVQRNRGAKRRRTWGITDDPTKDLGLRLMAQFPLSARFAAERKAIKERETARPLEGGFREAPKPPRWK